MSLCKEFSVCFTMSRSFVAKSLAREVKFYIEKKNTFMTN